MMLPVTIARQPSFIDCGPTCLHAIYQYYQDAIELQQVVSEVARVETGGTLAVLLGCHALARGYRATIHSLNLHVLDPSWFTLNATERLKEHSINLEQKLERQLQHKQNARVQQTTQAYLEFLRLGGEIRYGKVTEPLIDVYFKQQVPLISGISSTYFYQSMRDLTTKDSCVYDELSGEPGGHFIVLRHIAEGLLAVADPLGSYPHFQEYYYSVAFDHWLHAHLLGIITDDAELLAIRPASG